MTLESLYARLAAGTAKYRPKRDVLAVMDDCWRTTPEIQKKSGLSLTAVHKKLRALFVQGVVECHRHKKRRNSGRGQIPFKWRRRTKEKKAWAK